MTGSLLSTPTQVGNREPGRGGRCTRGDMRALVFTMIVALATAACSNMASESKVTPASSPPSANAISAPGGCGSTQAHKGGVPAWVEVAGAHNNPDSLPYVITDPP